MTGSALPIYNTLVTHPAMIKLLLDTTEQNATETAHHLVESFSPLEPGTFRKPLNQDQISSILKVKELYNIRRVKVFDPSGLVIYSTRGKDIGQSNRKDYFLEKVAQGKTLHKLVSNKEPSLDGVQVTSDVAEVYVPVMFNGLFVGAFEFYFDITEKKAAITSLSRSSFIFLVCVTLVLLLLFCLLGGRLRNAVERQRQMEQKVLALAYNDYLTGLPNRYLFQDRLRQTLAQAERNGKTVALLYMDIDHFKTINDTLGHDHGDLLLKSVAERMRRKVRRSDTLARIGGDEFVLLATTLNHSEQASKLAETLLEVFSRPFYLNGKNLFVTPSIGITVFPEDGQNAQQLLKHADIAMYAAKQQGRNRFACFNEKMNQRVMENHDIETCLRDALSREEFSLVYQPQIELKTGQVVGAEALLRWRHPQKGLIPPDRFIPIAEKTGLILEIGRWVLTEACRQNMIWSEMLNTRLKIAVNLSAYQLKQPDFVDTVKTVLNDTGIPCQLLGLELTESLAMDDSPTNIATLGELAELGIHLSIDDFGTGRSSLSYLRDLPIHQIKIDRSFIGHLPAGKQNRSIVDAIISMAKSLDLLVTAEGVETKAQLDFLKTRDCDLAQGYLIGSPMSATEISSLLQKVS